MSFAKITEIDSYFLMTYGEGIEEIIISEQAFNALLTDMSIKRDLTIESKENATNLKFYTKSGSIIVTKSTKDQIRITEEQILNLNDKLKKLKTKTGY